MKKLVIPFVGVASVSMFLLGCTHTEENIELKIDSECAENVCHIELVQADINKVTNTLGKTTEKVLKTTPLVDENNSITWSILGGNYATSQDMINNELPSCENDTCSSSGNPTGYVFPIGAATYPVSVSGTVVLSNGISKEVDQSADVIVEAPSVKTQITFTGENYASIPSAGTAPNSGISWTTSQGAITFTCPSGYAVPSNAVGLGANEEQTLNNSSETQSGRLLAFRADGSILFDLSNYGRGAYQSYNGITERYQITCVPASGANNYIV